MFYTLFYLQKIYKKNKGIETLIFTKFFKQSSIIIGISLLPLTGFTSSTFINEQNADTGLKTWGIIDSGLELKFIQRLPDQTRGFFLGRGFTTEQANDIATHCVFQTVAKNTQAGKEGGSVSLDLSQWILFVNGKQQKVKLKEDWIKEWQSLENTDKKVKKSAQIAFRWSTFPSQQTFEPGGDYNWGMISFGLPPGQPFDLQLKWLRANEVHSIVIKNIQCPDDV